MIGLPLIRSRRRSFASDVAISAEEHMICSKCHGLTFTPDQNAATCMPPQPLLLSLRDLAYQFCTARSSHSCLKIRDKQLKPGCGTCSHTHSSCDPVWSCANDCHQPDQLGETTQKGRMGEEGGGGGCQTACTFGF